MRPFTKFFNEEMEALICAGLNGGELTVFLHIARLTWGFSRDCIGFKPSDLTIPYSTARRALVALVSYGVINCLVDPVGPNPGKYSIGPFKNWNLPSQKRETNAKSLSKMRGLPSQKREASLSKMRDISSGIPTPTSDCQAPKENFKESLLKKTTPSIPQGGSAVEEGSFLDKLHDKLFTNAVAKIESTLGRVNELASQRLWAALRPPETGDIAKWSGQLIQRFRSQLAQVENAWADNSAAIKSPVGLLVARLETETAQLRKETEGR